MKMMICTLDKIIFSLHIGLACSCSNCCLVNLLMFESRKNTLSAKKGYNIIDKILEKYLYGNI